MSMPQMDVGKVKEFWNSRAELGFAAGSNDTVAKQLEIEAICKYVQPGMRVLDVGCGNGVTALDIAARFDVEVVGLDYAERMVENATVAAAERALQGTARFEVGNVCDLSTELREFDLVYSERVLINLPDWETQQTAIRGIGATLRAGGQYVMCENSLTSLEKMNALRNQLDLTSIEPPWHNRYLRDEEVDAARFDNLALEQIDDFSSTYYFLSRVVNAKLAADEGTEPRYDAPVNQLALQLPSMTGIGQTKLWIWKKQNA